MYGYKEDKELLKKKVDRWVYLYTQKNITTGEIARLTGETHYKVSKELKNALGELGTHVRYGRYKEEWTALAKGKKLSSYEIGTRYGIAPSVIENVVGSEFFEKPKTKLEHKEAVKLEKEAVELAIDEKTLKRWIDMYNSGITYKGIAFIENRSLSYIYKAINDHVKVVGYKQYAKEWKRMYDSGHTIRQIAKWYKTSHQVVAYHIKKLNKENEENKEKAKA